MAQDPSADLIDEIGLSIRMHQDAVDEVAAATVARLGINRSDGRGLDVLERRDRLTAGELAAETGLTTGAVTALLDRLETAGFVRRVREDADRRRVLIELTEESRRGTSKIHGPIAVERHRLLQGYTEEQLVLIRDFLEADRESLLRHAARIRTMKAETRSERLSEAPEEAG